MKKKGKRANGDGSIRQRDNGQWELRISVGYNPKTGRPISKSFSFKTEKEAREKQRKLQEERAMGLAPDYDIITVEEWLAQWFDAYLENVRPQTKKSYESDIRLYLNPTFGSKLLKELKPIDVQKAVNSWHKGTVERKALSPKTIHDIHGTLHTALEAAIQEELIMKNPAHYTKLPTIPGRTIHTLDVHDIAMLLESLHGDLYEDVILVDIMTGMRESEILGLTWDCIDFAKKEITVKQQLMKHPQTMQYYLDPTTKTKQTRTIAAPGRVMQTLARIREEQKKMREQEIAFEIWHEDIPNLVFTNETGGHLTQATALKHLQRAAQQCGLGHIKFHELRHTFATMSIANIGINGEGGSIKAVQETLGHSSTELTLNTYAHGTDVSKRLMADKFDHIFSEILTVKDDGKDVH